MGASAIGLWIEWHLAAPVWTRVSILFALCGVAAAVAFRFSPPFDPSGQVRWRLPRPGTRTKSCAITFDDGPSPATTAVLDILERESVPATFFVLASHVERHPEVVRRAAASGHAIGIHGVTHTRLDGASPAIVEQQIAGSLERLTAAGVTPAPLLRTPHGAKSIRVLSAARRHGLTVWAWTRGVWDTDRPSPSVLVRRATRFARSGMVLLLHDGRGDETAPQVESMLHALPGIIGELKRRGFTFVTLADV